MDRVALFPSFRGDSNEIIAVIVGGQRDAIAIIDKSVVSGSAGLKIGFCIPHSIWVNPHTISQGGRRLLGNPDPASMLETAFRLNAPAITAKARTISWGELSKIEYIPIWKYLRRHSSDPYVDVIDLRSYEREG